MPPWGGCGFPTIVSLYSANTALRITPGILPESVGVVKRKCRLDPPTAFAAVGRVQRQTRLKENATTLQRLDVTAPGW